ncbi:transposable element Tcb1 transposase [Trichonephila clavipes]|nr:transposable element Tcb1 transposase [Trichonephila clavipes]
MVRDVLHMARHLRMVREDTRAPSEGTACAWMAADEAVACTRVFLTMWRSSPRLVCGGHPGRGLRVNGVNGIPWIHSEIGSRVGRNQTTVMRMCDRWIQEDTTDQRDRSHPPQCTTSREDRQIVRMAVTDRSVTSRTVTQHIESAKNHSASARTIRLRLQQSVLSARRPLLGLPLTQSHRRLRRQWCNERRMWAV